MQTHQINVSKSALLVVEADNKELPALPHVKGETYEVIDAAVRAGITVDAYCDDSTTQENIAASLESAQLMHVSSHGIQHPFEPLKSGICLNDGVLTVERLMKLDIKTAFFAFLSACETAKGHRGQPDQAIHLAATLLFTGFKSVVGTMWYVLVSLNREVVTQRVQDNERLRWTGDRQAVL
jgi:CHAT domain-containing protein